MLLKQVTVTLKNRVALHAVETCDSHFKKSGGTSCCGDRRYYPAVSALAKLARSAERFHRDCHAIAELADVTSIIITKRC